MSIQQHEVTAKVVLAIGEGEFHSTAGLAKWIGAPRHQVVASYDDIEAAGLKLMRVRGPGGGVQFLGKRMRKAS